TRRVFIYEPRCSITAAGRSRNSEWLRSKDSLSRVRSAGRLPPGIDMSAPPSQTNIAIPPALSNTPATTGLSEARFKRGTLEPTAIDSGAHLCRSGHAPLRREALKCTLGVHPPKAQPTRGASVAGCPSPGQAEEGHAWQSRSGPPTTKSAAL